MTPSQPVAAAAAPSLWGRVAVAAWACGVTAACALLRRRRTPARAPTAQLLITGSGTSCGVPCVRCLTAHVPDPRVPPGPPPPDPTTWGEERPCRVCHDAVRPGSKNRRRNTGCVLRVAATGRAVAIDVGKYFIHSAIDLFPREGVRFLDAVVLTHDHADAVLGLDDLRDWAVLQPDRPLPVHCAPETLAAVGRAFPYLVDTSKATGSGFVPRLAFHRFDPSGCAAFAAAGVQFLPLPVEHGPNYTCYGFRFGDAVWLSDVSAVPDAAFEAMNAGGPLELLVVDALRPLPHVSHFGIGQAVELARRLRPRRTLLIGASHMVDHERENARLRREVPDLDVQFAYDGQTVDLYSAI